MSSFQPGGPIPCQTYPQSGLGLRGGNARISAFNCDGKQLSKDDSATPYSFAKGAVDHSARNYPHEYRDEEGFCAVLVERVCSYGGWNFLSVSFPAYQVLVYHSAKFLTYTHNSNWQRAWEQVSCVQERGQGQELCWCHRYIPTSSTFNCRILLHHSHLFPFLMDFLTRTLTPENRRSSSSSRAHGQPRKKEYYGTDALRMHFRI